MLAAGFCERWPATHEREGFSGWPPCQRVAAQRKKLAANEQEYNQCRLLRDELSMKHELNFKIKYPAWEKL
jgi:hypothetical protein